MTVGVYLTVQEVAELARCEHKAVRRAISQGRLTAFRPAHKILVREEDARAWIEGQCVSGQAARTSRLSPRRQANHVADRPGSVADLKAIRESVVSG